MKQGWRMTRKTKSQKLWYQRRIEFVIRLTPDEYELLRPEFLAMRAKADALEDKPDG